MPLDVVRLMDSDLFALSTGDEFKAAVAAWCKCWLQLPAGSLPDDDRVLAHLTGTGTKWRKLRTMALRGFVKCTDGRLYHPVVCEKVLEAWQMRLRQRERSARGNAKRWGETSRGDPRGDPRGDASRDPQGKNSPSPEDVSHHRKGQGQGQGQYSDPNGSAHSANGRDDPAKTMFDTGVRVLTNRGISERQARAVLGKCRSELHDDGKLLNILLTVERENPVEPLAYLSKAVSKAASGGIIPMHPGAGG